MILDALTYAGNLGTIAKDIDNERCVFIKGDICSRDVVDGLFAEYRFDYVVNFAAESHVDRSIENPQLFLITNILGTQNLLDCARRAWVMGKDEQGYPTWRKGVRYHQVSTDEVYGSLGAEGYFTEATPLCPHSPYSASKTSADMVVMAYHDTYKNAGNDYPLLQQLRSVPLPGKIDSVDYQEYPRRKASPRLR